MSASTTALRVYSYNLLSSSLASPGYFRHCTPSNLDSSARLKKILAKLQVETTNKSIICLQELTRSWEGPLHVFFEQRGYQLVTGLYGRAFNGYMGVAMAYPMDKYEAKDVEVQVRSERGARSGRRASKVWRGARSDRRAARERYEQFRLKRSTSFELRTPLSPLFTPCVWPSCSHCAYGRTSPTSGSLPATGPLPPLLSPPPPTPPVPCSLTWPSSSPIPSASSSPLQAAGANRYRSPTTCGTRRGSGLTFLSRVPLLQRAGEIGGDGDK